MQWLNMRTSTYVQEKVRLSYNPTAQDERIYYILNYLYVSLFDGYMRHANLLMASTYYKGLQPTYYRVPGKANVDVVRDIDKQNVERLSVSILREMATSLPIARSWDLLSRKALHRPGYVLSN
jgi:hypothetical protein